MRTCTKNIRSQRLYRVWLHIKDRCNNPNHPKHKIYYDKGIKMCKEWREDYLTFEQWAFDNGYNPFAKKMQCTIDRIDNDKGYSPDNCRWVDNMTNCNNKTNNHIETYKGISHTMAEWERILGLKTDYLYSKLKKYGTFENYIESESKQKEVTRNLITS